MNNIKTGESHVVFCVMGKTASGKSTLAKDLAKKMNLNILKSYTTRAPRESELKDLDNCDHIFIKDEDVDVFKHEIIAYTEINGNKYFATASQLAMCDFYVIDPNGLRMLSDKITERDMNIMLVPIIIEANVLTRMSRYIKRGGDSLEFSERNTDEFEQFKRFKEERPECIVVQNSNGYYDSALEELEKIVVSYLQK